MPLTNDVIPSVLIIWIAVWNHPLPRCCCCCCCCRLGFATIRIRNASMGHSTIDAATPDMAAQIANETIRDCTKTRYDDS